MNGRVMSAIAGKDIADAIRNRYILFCLVLPLGLSLLFRVIMPSDEDLASLTVAILDPDGSRLVTQLREAEHVELIEVTSEEALIDALDEDAAGGLSVPSGFDAALEAGGQPELAAYINTRGGGFETQAFREFVERQIWSLIDQPEPASVRWSDVAELRGEPVREFDLDTHLLVMLLLMALAMTGAFAVPMLLVEEKEKNTLEVLLVSPARPADVVMGKALTGALYSVVIAGLLVVLNRGGWSGNVPVTALAITLGLLFTIGAGLLLGSLVRTTMQVNTWASIVMLLLILPGMIPGPEASRSLAIVLRLIPSYYLAESLKLALGGHTSGAAVWGNLGVLAAGTVAVFAVAVWTLRREIQ